MKKLGGLLLALALVLSSASPALAQLPDTTWEGSAQVTYNGDVKCTTTPESGAARLSLRPMQDGWLQQQFEGGCAQWMADILMVRVSGNDLLDPAGRKIGTIDDTHMAARGYLGRTHRTIVDSFELTLPSEDTAQLVVELRHPPMRGLFRYTATLSKKQP